MEFELFYFANINKLVHIAQNSITFHKTQQLPNGGPHQFHSHKNTQQTN
jgi:hypothetical protein